MSMIFSKEVKKYAQVEKIIQLEEVAQFLTLDPDPAT